MKDAQVDKKVSLAHLGLGAAWLVGLAAALQLVEMLLGKSPLASAMAGAVLADVVAGFAGVRWDSQAPKGAKTAAKETKEAGKAPSKAQEEGAPASGARPAGVEAAKASGEEVNPVRDIGIGMATALVAVIVTLLVGAVLGWVMIERGGPSTSIAFALMRSAATGVRDELMLRGIVLTAAARAGISPRIAAVVAALAGGAVLALVPSVSIGAVALAITSGFFFALLWQRFRGAWAAVGAHAFWVFLISAALRGGFVDVAWSSGSLTSGGRSTGGAAWLAAGVFALLSAAALFDERKRAARRAG
jgi:hypothetical protein